MHPCATIKGMEVNEAHDTVNNFWFESLVLKAVYPSDLEQSFKLK